MGKNIISGGRVLTLLMLGGAALLLIFSEERAQDPGSFVRAVLVNKLLGLVCGLLYWRLFCRWRKRDRWVKALW